MAFLDRSSIFLRQDGSRHPGAANCSYRPRGAASRNPVPSRSRRRMFGRRISGTYPSPHNEFRLSRRGLSQDMGAVAHRWRSREPASCAACHARTRIATMALEMIGPTPGTLISRSQPASWRASVSIYEESSSMRSSKRRQSPASSSMVRAMRGDRVSEGAARMFGSAARRKRCPCRTATPRSSRKARI